VSTIVKKLANTNAEEMVGRKEKESKPSLLAKGADKKARQTGRKRKKNEKR